MESRVLIWASAGALPSKSYICGYCGNDIAENKGYSAQSPLRAGLSGRIYICHYCSSPTYFDEHGYQWPGASFGEEINDLPENGVGQLYDEARRCIGASCYTASVLCSRKLLMNIAVSRGASEGWKFIEYIDYLAEKGYLPPDGREWVDQIRSKGNEATHEIALMKKEDAEDLVTFIEMLLRFIFEFPAIAKRNKEKKA